MLNTAIAQCTAATEYEKNAWSQVGNAETQSHAGSSRAKKMMIKSNGYRNSFDVQILHTLSPSSGAITEMGLIGLYP